MTTTVAIESGLQTIPLAAISPNPQNPRKHFDPAALKDLAESIKSHGVRQPVLVRPGSKAGHFTLVCGERRLRASKLAGKADIPAIVDPNLTDRQALEIGILENLQRECVHPLDEALGYEALLKMDDKGDKETVEGIAAKVGKSKEYVYARLKLTALIPAGREAFQTDRITAGHAVLIARLQPRDQLKAIGACFNEYDIVEDFKDHDPKNVQFGMIVDDTICYMGTAPGLIPEKALREWIQDNVNLKLKDVPWDLNDALLLPEAGACSSCEKRSSTNPALFSELTIKGEDTCFDAACYGKKREAFVKIQLDVERRKKREIQKGTPAGVEMQMREDMEPLRQISEQTGYTKVKPDQRILKQGQWLPAKKGECLAVETGLIVNGENAGQKRLVCCNGACKVHKHNLQAGPEPRSEGCKALAEAHGRAKKAVADRLMARVLSGAVAKIKKPDMKTLRRMAESMLTGWYGDPFMIAHVLEIPGIKRDGQGRSDVSFLRHYAKNAGVAELLQTIYLLALGDDLAEWAPEFREIAKFGGIDPAKARKELEAKIKRACHFCGCTELTPCAKTTAKNEGGHRMDPPYKTVDAPCHWIPKGAPATDKRDNVCSNPACVEAAMKEIPKNSDPAPASKVKASAKKGDKKS